MKIFGSHMACGIQECILVESTRPSPESSLCSGPWNECAYKAVCAGLFPKGLACKAETIFFRRCKRECVCGSFYMQQHVCDKVSSLFPDCFLRVLACLSRLFQDCRGTKDFAPAWPIYGGEICPTPILSWAQRPRADAVLHNFWYGGRPRLNSWKLGR